MKKKFYDFSVSTAIIVVLAYIMVLILSIYTTINSEGNPMGGIIFSSVLLLTLIALIIYYGFYPVVLTESFIRQRNKTIEKKYAYWIIRRNYRYRCDELVVRNKTINYHTLPKKEIKKFEIVVQHFPKYELFLESYLGTSEGLLGE